MTMDYDVLIYTDGACSGNPGPGAWAYIFYDAKQGHVLEQADFAAATTNNRMEIEGVLRSLDKVLQQSAQKVILYSDSVYVLKGANIWLNNWKRQGWKKADGQEISNPDLWQKMDQILIACKEKKIKIDWRYCPGHKGIPGNERCDQLAVALSKQSSIDTYQGAADYYIFDIRTLPENIPWPTGASGGGPSANEKKQVYYISYLDHKLVKHNTWNECSARVQGRRGALYKKIQSQTEYKETLTKWGLDPQSTF
jgi:ribonuclease HI